jgi:hypothetical protein
VVHATDHEGENAVKRKIDGAYRSTEALLTECAAYAAVSNIASKGATVIATVALPGWLEFEHFNLATLDMPGAASPAPGTPLNHGDVAVIPYLLPFGYTVASVTSAPAVGDGGARESNISIGIENYRAMAIEFVGWAHDHSGLSHLSAHGVRIGTLEYFSSSTLTTPR